MKAVVTGANGFVGRRVVSRFCELGASVSAASRRPMGDLPDGARWVAAPDLTAKSDWSHVVRGADVVVHAAARVHVMNDTASDPLSEFRQVNRDGTLALAAAAAAAGVKRFLFLSSIKVNGESTPPDRPFRDNDEPSPSDPYGVSKLEAEQALFELSRSTGMEVVVVRPVLVYGPGVRANFRTMLKAVRAGIPLPLGALRNRRSMVFVDNLADLVCVAAVHPAAAGEVLLVSDGDDLSTAEMLRLLARSMQRPARLIPIAPALLTLLARLGRREDFARRLFGSLVVDTRPTQELLDWTPPFTVEHGFLKTARAFLEESRTDA